MPRGNPSGVRSGRINSPDATDPIIITKMDTVYRFSNTAKTAFSVKYTLAGSETKIEVKKHCSIDVKIPANVSVFVEGSPATGVFDLLQTGKPARGGKIKIAPSGEIVIAKRRPKAIYRVFNGGEVAFQTVPPPATAALANIPPKSSRDVIVPALVTDPLEGDLKIADAGAKVLGAFDTVDTADIRSGRFVFTSAAGARDYLIVDLSAEGCPEQTYRITNTGDDPFKVVVGATAVTELATDQTIDVQIIGGGANSILKVRAKADAKTLTGIYDNI